MTEKYMNLKEEITLYWTVDEYPESPREWSNLGTFITFDSSYYSPDKHNFNEPADFISSILGEETTERIYDKYNNTNDFLDDVIPKMDKKGFIVFPVSAYEHGMIRYYLGADSGWDTRTDGFIFVEKEKAYKEFNTKRITKKVLDNIERIFEGELENYTRYANGEVYGFVIEDLKGDHLDSCYGIYDDCYDFEGVFEMISHYQYLGKKEDWQEYDEDVIENYLDEIGVE